jgi:pepsin A
MSLKTVLSLLAAIQAVRADFSHPLHFKKVDAVAAKSIAAVKGRVAPGTGALVDDQVLESLPFDYRLVTC